MSRIDVTFGKLQLLSGVALSAALFPSSKCLLAPRLLVDFDDNASSVNCTWRVETLSHVYHSLIVAYLTLEWVQKRFVQKL